MPAAWRRRESRGAPRGARAHSALRYRCQLPAGAHGVPPCAGAVPTVRVRDMRPPPQVALQAEVLPHADSWQSMGHGWVLQLRLEVAPGQEAPPWAGALTTERVLDWTPPPHFSVQREKRDQAETLQLTEHLKELQLR